MIKAKISKNVIKRNRNGKMNFAATGQKTKYFIAIVISLALIGITYKLTGIFNGWITMLEVLAVFILIAYEREGMNIVVYCYKVFTNNKDIRLFDRKSFLTNLTDRSGKK